MLEIITITTAIIVILMIIMIKYNNNNNNNIDDTERCNSRYLTTYSQCYKLSPTCTIM